MAQQEAEGQICGGKGECSTRWQESLSPFSSAQPPRLLSGLEIHHLSSLLPGSSEELEKTVLLQLVPESLGSSQGYVRLCS